MEEKEIMKMLLEDDLLQEAKDLYGMNIEPRGKELYFLKKDLRKDSTFEHFELEHEKIYGGAFSRTVKWDKVWRNFKSEHDFLKVVK